MTPAQSAETAALRGEVSALLSALKVAEEALEFNSNCLQWGCSSSGKQFANEKASAALDQIRAATKGKS